MSRARQEAEEYVTAAAPRLLGLARALTRDPVEAEDLLQDTLTKVYTSWSKVRRADHVDAYVRRVMVNTLLSQRTSARWRRERSVERIDEVVDHRRSAPDITTEVTDGAYVLQVLATLPRLQRVVLTLRFLEDLSDDAIADELGIGRSSVASAASRGLTTLRASITPEEARAGSLGRRAVAEA